MKRLLGFLIFLSMLTVLGCASTAYQQQYKEAAKKNCDVIQEIAKSKQDYSASSNQAKLKSQFYPNNVYRTGSVPAWFNQHIALRANNMPLDLAVSKILPANSLSVQYQEGAQRGQLINMDYNGSVQGALDKLAGMTGYSYTIEDGRLIFSSFVTKTFDVSFMPGTSQYMVGQGQGDSMLSTSSSSSASNVATGTQSDAQYSSLVGNLSVWKDLHNAISGMLSPDGKVMVSESTTTITVRDHPQNVQAVSDYLASMNSDLSKEVLLKVRVLQIALNKQFNYGVDWNLAYNTAAKIGFSTGDLSQPVNLAQGSLLTSSPVGPSGIIGLGAGGTNGSLGIPGISAGIASGPFQNTQILINALTQQGAVSNITNPEVVTLNNQVAQIDISRQTTYLASSTTTLTSGSSGQSSGFSQTSLNPGIISTGFKLYVLPKIMNKNIYLQISSELSKLTDLKTLTVGGSNGSSSIQLPTIDGKHFNLRSLVPSGATLIVAGFNSVDTVAGNNSSFGVFGGKGSSQNNTETVLLITPQVITGNNR